VFPHSTIGEVSVEIAKQIESGDPRSLRLIAAGQGGLFVSFSLCLMVFSP
jgi:hypothetical protein